MICHEVHKTFGAVINMDKNKAFLPFILERQHDLWSVCFTR